MDAEQQRTAVLDAAERLFYGKGIQAVGMDEIRAAAGVSLKAIYKLFPSKDLLVAEVLAIRDRRWTDGLHKYVDRADTPEDKVLAVFDWLDEMFAENDFRGCSFINSYGELGATSPTVAQAAQHNKSCYQDEVNALVADAGLPPTVAVQVGLLTEGALATAAILGPDGVADGARQAARVLIGAQRSVGARTAEE
ncbi:Transcriptional regulator, TetR family OS=Tsukamurella paurometabola (strain ATCC 8368 / DSM/ CCUG 35730 / CIP 100753 / JCM 10117 / KCTC 9821 / NBRC 16120/ NCIMB 702349 / NCTC 13040) OX=521096 GN=Tpau_2930 PE=4 SV=1 [Tsukamurella paurometabola]|uniref:Transcriptional regulator, TetR family n=1 Tax=Tsukamurella paurometabola (strain ATCC 8368 / DSM 20162 / CCUG 35730 / CIP 100753 / JCM 10117 / KCTC 9821 / NBRC 16120 / NCIMB 702349 / NCTC 13040) TaxID=521096 RepID=D5UU25_TSUPD|nr:TetR/AcrR family transcriptional regulator [Tsukamurella paurometabola]ADG79528.1 transcriptional regulator, TetR family [Tsukamurella paurometabola DSM 20162]SUP36103.1 putative transcriptional regulator [Tsukamurella paurometabola]